MSVQTKKALEELEDIDLDALWSDAWSIMDMNPDMGAHLQDVCMSVSKAREFLQLEEN